MTTYLHQINSPEDLKQFSAEELPLVVDELRQFILETISKTGGHLGAAMGVVEIAVALHYVFDSPSDRIVWDVGHQGHAHKILTGRRDRFHTIKQEGGLSGFLKRSESEHDIFGAGHASTSVSAALGILEALRLKDDRGKVVAVIGDGGLTGGMAFEALNNAGALKRDLIVVLNDNGMSISPNVGGLSEWFSRKLTGDHGTRWRRRVRTMLGAFDHLGQDAIKVFEHLLDATKHVLVSPGLMFEGMGFEYVGPINGHDCRSLVQSFVNAKKLGKPVVVHAITEKGKGCPGVDEDHERKHAISPVGKKKAPGKPAPPTYTQVFGNTVCQLAAEDPRIVAITAAMTQGTGLVEFSKKYPGRFYDVGIAEQHAVTFAAGLAAEGFRPFCTIYSTFLQRAFDQIIHDVCLQKLPVIFCLDRGGIVGADGPTHHGVFDLSYLRLVPHMAILAPKNEQELREMMVTALRCDVPVAIRYPRGSGRGVALADPPAELPWGKAEVVHEEGHDLLIAAVGPHVYTATDALEALAKIGVKATVINARFVKPLDTPLFVDHLRRASAVITLEENAIFGGFGSAILELCAENNIHVPTRCIGVPDRFVDHGNVPNLQGTCGLSVDGILAAYVELRPPPTVISIPPHHVAPPKSKSLPLQKQ